MASNYSVWISQSAQVVLAHLPCKMERQFRQHVESLAEAASVASARFPLLGARPARLQLGELRLHCEVDHASRTVRVFALVHHKDMVTGEFGRELFRAPPAYRE